MSSILHGDEGADLMKCYRCNQWDGQQCGCRDGCTIFHGDCFSVLPQLTGIAGIVTDPPYSSGGAFRGDRAAKTVVKYVSSGCQQYRPEFGGDNRDQRSYFAWCSLWMTAAYYACNEGAVFLCFTDWRQLPITTDAMQCGGWVWRNIGTWWKPGMRMQKGRLSSSAEYIVYGSKGIPLEGGASVQNVIREAPVPGDERQHIAEKPQVVCDWALSVVPGGTVLDPFCGSGAIVRAAKLRGLNVIGSDADERCCELTASRLRQEVLF